MKFLLQVGHELDLNVNWDGGGVDNVTYQVSAGSEDIISVTSAGIVEGLAVGTAVVEFVNSNVVVGSAIFEVLTATQMISRQALRDGDKDLVIDVAEVAAIIKISPTLTQFYEVGPDGYVFFAGGYGPGFVRGAGVSGSGPSIDGRYDFLWDGLTDTYWYASSANGTFGYFATAATTIKEVRIQSNHQNLTARPAQIIIYGSNVEPTDYAGGVGNPAFAFGNDSGWTQIASQNLTWGGSVSEQRVIDVTSNDAAYKHYKIKAVCAEAFVALGGVEFWGLA